MSQPRFAPITASLLARKGEAAPLCAKQPLAWLQDVAPQPPPMLQSTPQMSHGMADPGEKPHRIMVALSNREYETLGIAAVKKGTTRHRIAREAMDHYFATLAREFHDRCACVSDAAREGGCCRDA
ncbi:MAG TPA: hypothetical protein VGF56_01570 [Rhizomicrobium sp.]|jgi:alpha-beta hydrolase superfamily lysophospholipase